MKLTPRQMQLMKAAPNSAYDAIKPEFLYHSNKIEGSTFTEAELIRLVDEGIVSGDHSVDDVYETKNSLDVFDHVVDNLGEPISAEMLCEMNRLLFSSTTEEANGFTGHYKLIPNRISGSRVQLALPDEVPQVIGELLAAWEGSAKDFQAIADFHARFEHVHPFQNGNGRIGRFLMLKQCIENDVDIIAIDEEFERPYKAWLEVAQADGDSNYYYETLRDCQALFDQKMEQKGIKRLIPYD